jgi:serine/threonine protein kinase
LPENQTPIQQLQPGYVLVDRYAIQMVIGVGGMGSVYRARDLHFPNVVKLVAVKEMINQAPDPLVRKTIVQNFEREANILVALSHTSIPKIFDYFTFEDRSYLVLEYIHGKDLEAVLNETEGFMPEDMVIGWAIELCDVLQYLHNHKPEPIIFRDMKPSNVMVNQQGHIMLVDFGIAKIFRSGQKGTMIGTEGYSPPEQYRGEATPLADIYALGATMHHLLTHRDPRLEPPFTFAERPVRKENPSVSPELEAVINTALQYNPLDRFQSAEAMKDSLTAVARKTGALNRIAVGTSQITNDTAIKPLWTFKCEDEIRGSPNCEGGMVFVGAYDNNMYAVNAADGQFVWKFPTEGGIVSKPFVNEGIVYFGSEDGNLYAISSRTGKIQWSYHTNAPIRCSPRLAEGHVFFGSDDGFFNAVNIMTNRLTWQVDASTPIRSTCAIAGDLIYFGCESGDFYSVDFRGQTKWRYKAKRAVTSSPQVSQGVVFFGSVDSSFYALDAKSGWIIWRFRMGKGSVSSPCRAENDVFIGSADGFIYCVEATNAREIWRFKTDHQVSGSPIIYKDALYCGSADGNLYCIEYKSGRLRWKFTTGGAITGTPVVNNDVLYIGSADHLLYALMA